MFDILNTTINDVNGLKYHHKQNMCHINLVKLNNFILDEWYFFGLPCFLKNHVKPMPYMILPPLSWFDLRNI